MKPRRVNVDRMRRYRERADDEASARDAAWWAMTPQERARSLGPSMQRSLDALSASIRAARVPPIRLLPLPSGI